MSTIIRYRKNLPNNIKIKEGIILDLKNPNAPALSCAVIIKQVDEKTRSKTSINDLLRE
jgi:2,3,4,5-tetrahydropyridine-2-carboxylate N-succinyltransferase